MREILFRGKRAYNGEWVYGSLILWKDGDAEICVSSTEEREEQSKFIVHPETVGQFTGLTDKNGKKIFEGDIVRDEYNGGIARIAFLQQGCGWYLVFKNTDRRMGHRSRNSAYDNDLALEVIGNIHDNPELMEVSEDGK